MRQSQYTQSYLATTCDPATRYTVGTYLAYTLRGSARWQWGDTYERGLVNSLLRLVADGSVVKTRSVRGGLAFVYA